VFLSFSPAHPASRPNRERNLTLRASHFKFHGFPVNGQTGSEVAEFGIRNRDGAFPRASDVLLSVLGGVAFAWQKKCRAAQGGAKKPPRLQRVYCFRDNEGHKVLSFQGSRRFALSMGRCWGRDPASAVKNQLLFDEYASATLGKSRLLGGAVA
jgi:hypothetical protein